MAQAKSWIKLRGSMGETTFKRRGKKTFANDKVVISAERMKTHPKFTSLRKNGKQMGNASKSAKAIRFALSGFVFSCKDPKMTGRFNAELMKVLKRDTSQHVHTLGRVARAENMGLLLGFDFNEKAKLRTTFNVPFNTDVNRQTGEVKINIGSFRPDYAVKAPPLATQFKIVAQVADIDFDPAVDFNHKYEKIAMYSSEYIQLNSIHTGPLSITFNVKTGNLNTIYIALGVDFLDPSNPLYESVDVSKKVNSGCIVGVNEGVAVPFTGPAPEGSVEEDKSAENSELQV